MDMRQDGIPPRVSINKPPGRIGMITDPCLPIDREFLPNKVQGFFSSMYHANGRGNGDGQCIQGPSPMILSKGYDRTGAHSLRIASRGGVGQVDVPSWDTGGAPSFIRADGPWQIEKSVIVCTTILPLRSRATAAPNAAPGLMAARVSGAQPKATPPLIGTGVARTWGSCCREWCQMEVAPPLAEPLPHENRGRNEHRGRAIGLLSFAKNRGEIVSRS